MGWQPSGSQCTGQEFNDTQTCQRACVPRTPSLIGCSVNPTAEPSSEPTSSTSSPSITPTAQHTTQTPSTSTTESPLGSIAFSLDQCQPINPELETCDTPNPVYPNGEALSDTFLLSTYEAGLVASLQNFDSEPASSPVPNAIFSPPGSAFNGSVDISAQNGFLVWRQCKSAAAAAAAAAKCDR